MLLIRNLDSLNKILDKVIDLVSLIFGLNKLNDQRKAKRLSLIILLVLILLFQIGIITSILKK